MATREDLENALVKAHNSGDFEAANLFASMIKGGEFDPETTALGALGEAGKRLAGGVATGTARIGTGLAELVPFIDDESAQAVQKDVDEFVAEKLAYDPAYDESYIAQLGETVGEMVPMVGSLFIPGGAPARAAQLLTMIGPAVSEGGMDRAEYEERTGEDLSTAERLVSKSADIGLGMLEKLGLPARVVKGLPKGFFQTPEGNPILKRIESMVASGLREGVQEVGQGIARDISTLAIYDPDRKIADSAIEDFTLGGGAGAVFDLAIGLAQQPLRGRKGKAPKPIEEMTDEEVEAEIEERRRFDEAEGQRRQEMDETIAAADIGPQISVREDPLDPTEVDSELDAEEMASQVILRLGSRMPVGKTFSVETKDGKSFAEFDGEQFGPAIEDPTVAQELSNRLTETSQLLEKSAGVEYIVETSGIEYTEQQADEVRRLGRSIPSPQQRVISAEDANLATGKDIASVINDMMARKKATEESGRTGISFEEAYEIARAETDTEVFTLEEVRAANKGDIGNLGDVIAEKDADFLAFEPQEPVTPTAPIDPTRPRQPALGRRQQALAALSRSFDNIIASERAFTDLLARKRIDTTVDSEPFRGLIKKIIGKTPSKKSPLENLTPNERRYLYHRLRKLPSFQEQATQIPDFSTKTPNADLVRIARRQIEVDQPARIAVEGAAFGQTGQPPSQAEVRRVEAEARRTARPLPRNQARQVLEQYPRAAQLSLAELESYSPSLPSSPDVYTEGSRDVGAVRKGDYRADLGIPSEDAYFEVLDAKRQLEGVPAGQEIVPFDINESALGQQLRDALKKFGIDDEYAVRMVEKVGEARRDSDGNIYIMPVKSDPNKVVYGSAQAGAKVIQVGLDGVMDLVNRGATYEQAVARVMNHEILHALRAMDLFTASEYSLLERLSRKYQKPGTGKTYGQWAFDEYRDASAVVQQEEAIAELISDSLTTGVVMDGTVKKPTGKPQSIFRKIVDFFKGMVGVAKNNDVESFKDLVDNIQSGVVGRRERGQVRTPFRTEKGRGEVAERGITKEDIELETGKRKRPLNAKQVINKVRKDLPDAPVTVDEAMLSSRLKRAEEQGFDTSEVFYHGSVAYKPIEKFQGEVGRGAIAGHFTRNPELASAFAQGAINDALPRPTIYPVFLKKGTGANNQGGLFAVRQAEADGALQEVLKAVITPFSPSSSLGRDLAKYYERQINRDFVRVQTEGMNEIMDRFYGGEISIGEAAVSLAREYHQELAPLYFKNLKKSTYYDNTSFEELEIMAPYIKDAGFIGYYDIEEIRAPYSAIAMFNAGDVKGVFADYDPTAVPEGARYEDDIMFSRRSDAGGISSRDMFSGTDPDMFDPDTGEVDYGLRHKSRKVVVDMPIDMFLHLAASGARADSEALVRELAESNKKFDRIPLLRMSFESGKPEHRYVYDHDGRHRARQLKSMGYDTVPVMVMDDSIRWDQQGEGSYDRVKTWPRSILNQDGDFVFPMFLDRNANVRYGRFGPQSKDDIMFSRRSDMPPPENAQRTQISGTLPTYRKATDILDKEASGDRSLDFGAGLGLGAQEFGYDSYEPFPREGFSPTYTSPDQIEPRSYDKIVNLNVLNVVPRDARDRIVKDIGTALDTGGVAIITTRGKDVLNAKGKKGPEPTSVITTRGTYQKGFSRKELVDYLKETLGPSFEVSPLNLGPAGAIVRRTDFDSSSFSRRATPITNAVARARKKHDGVRFSTEEEFFGKVWPSLMREVGGTVPSSKLRVAAKRAVSDLKEWVKNNPKYNDYYSEDMRATRASLEAEYGPISDEEFALYQFLNGVNSPGTSLASNVGDAIKAFDLYKRDGNFDAIKMGLSDQGNPVVAESPYKISALTAPGKARSMKALDVVVRDKGSLKAALDFLLEPVTMQELEAFKKSLGYAGVSKKGDIRGLVEDATGQAQDKNQLIPRMFFLGPKLGAYTLNLMGDSRYQTVDVWEARFIRSYFDNMYDTNTGITMTVEEGRLFRDFSKVFSEEFEKVAGYKADPATLQAMRWFYMINAAKEAGYSGASTNETISELTERQIENTRGSRYGGRKASAQPIQVGEQAARVRAKPTTKSIETKVIAPRQTITSEQAEEAVKKNIESIEANPLGVPRFSVKASPEAQYIAQNPEKGLPSDDPMFSVRGDIPAVDKLTKGPDREDTNGRVFMRVLETGPIGVALTKLKAGALNRYAALEKYYQKIPGLRELEAESSAIVAALMSDKSKAILGSAVKYGVPVYNNGYTRVEDFVHDGETYRGLIGVMSLIYNKDVGDLRKLAQAYAMVQRGEYLKGKNKLTPVDPKSRKEILEAVDALTDADGYNPVKKWHEVWSAYNNKTIEFLKATGILNDETADEWKASSYVPFYRSGASDDALPNVAKNIFGDLTRMSEFRAYQGSDKAVDVGLIESVVLNLSAAIDMGMKNVAQQRIVRDMQNMGIARQIKSGGAIPKSVNAIDFKVNGKKVRFEIDDNLIHDSMMSIGTGAGEQLAIKYLGMPANFLRETITRDPGFMIANMMRDTLSTAVTSGSSFIPVIDTLKGWTKGTERLERLGVVGGYDFSIDKKDILKYYKEEQKRREKSMAPLDLIMRVWNWAGEATTRSDAATRNAVYEDVLARTGNEAEASWQATEIINFSRRGANPLVRVITAAIPFLNARFQGLDVFVRAATGNYSTRKDLSPAAGQLKFAYRAGLMASLTALYYLMVSDEDWYKEQEDHIRELNWLVPTASGVPFRIPIPFEVGLLFKTLPEAMLATFFTGDQSKRELRETIQRGVTSTLEVNPLSIQAFGPLVEAAFNYNSFTGRPIVPYYVDKMTPGLTGTLNSTQIATDIGKVLPISPLKMDHIISGYSGTIGGYIISAVDALYRQARDVEDKRPAKAIFQYPLIKRFFASKEGSGLRTDAYDLYNDVYEVVTTINSLEKQGREDELRAYIASRQHILSLKSPVYSVKKQLDKARNQKRQIISSSLDPEIKRQMIEEIDSNLNEYLKVVPRLKQEMGAPFIQTTF